MNFVHPEKNFVRCVRRRVIPFRDLPRVKIVSESRYPLTCARLPPFPQSCGSDAIQICVVQMLKMVSTLSQSLEYKPTPFFLARLRLPCAPRKIVRVDHSQIPFFYSFLCFCSSYLNRHMVSCQIIANETSKFDFFDAGQLFCRLRASSCAASWAARSWRSRSA